MAVFNSCFTVLVIFVIAGLLISGDNVVSGQTCQSDLPGIIAQCSVYVRKPGPKVPPSKGCCVVLRMADVPCVCKYITKEVEQIISMEKVVYVAQFCGIVLKHGMKCGSYTVPAT